MSRLQGIPRVIDTGTLTLRFDTVLLYGVVGEGEPYRSELEGYIRDREVQCTRLDTAYRCMLEGKDLSEIVVRNGGGKAADDAPSVILEAQESAKRERRGVWQ